MTMNRAPNPLIDALAEELVPVKPMTMRGGMAAVAVAVAVTLVLVELFHGMWQDAFAGAATPFFWVTNGLLAVLGLASATSVVRIAGPRVGNRHEAPQWALAAVVVLPLAAIAALLLGHSDESPLADRYGLECAQLSLAFSLVIAGTLVLWLRRGAPVSLAVAGFHTGLAAGALGAAAYGLSCPLTGETHLGIWHVVPVFAMALAGRFAVPHLVRW